MNTVRKLTFLVLFALVCTALAFVTERDSSDSQVGEALIYQVQFIEDVPAFVYQSYEEVQTLKGFSAIQYNNARYILITMGATPTGGYLVEVDKVRKENSGWKIKVHLNPPEKGSLVTQAIAYPAIAVRLPGDGSPVEVLDQGQPLRKIR